MPIYPHRIRLRGPWNYEPVFRYAKTANGSLDKVMDNLPPPGRMTMPCHWRNGGLPGFAGRVRFRRRFGFPGNIDDFERVWLTFTNLTERGEISLNGTTLGNIDEHDDSWETEIKNLLQPRNELIVEVESLTDDGGIWGDVALEIRRTAFLRDVHAEWVQRDNATRIRAAGHVVGFCDRNLDLYLIHNGTTVGYDSVQPHDDPFAIVSDKIDANVLQTSGSDVLQVDLIDGGVIWYSVMVPIAKAAHE